MELDVPAQLPGQGYDLRCRGGESLLHLWLHLGQGKHRRGQGRLPGAVDGALQVGPAVQQQHHP